jgi:hypothetical protein
LSIILEATPLSLETIKANVTPFIPAENNNKKEGHLIEEEFSHPPRQYYMGKVETKLVLGFVPTTREVHYCLVSRHLL